MKAQRKQMVGRVSSNKMDKTVVVEVERTVRNRLYGKALNLTKK